jgi:hypothetical protein
MRSKSLLKTNPYLKDPELRKDIIETFVLSSSSIEGVHAAAERALSNISKRQRSTCPSSVSSSKARR